MERYIKRFVDRKLRKRGKDYHTSENTKLSGQDFIYANKIASRIYAFAKSLPTGGDRTVYRQLLRTILKMVRQDEVHELGQLRIGYGAVSDLKGFRFNPKQSWSGLIPWQTKIFFDLPNGQLRITVPKEKNWPLNNMDGNVSRLSVRYYLFCIPFELKDEIEIQSTKELVFTPGENGLSKTARLSIQQVDNSLILLFGCTQCYCWEDGNRQADYRTQNQLFLACDILEVYGVRNGALIEESITPHAAKPSAPNPEEDGADGVDWE